MDKPKFKHDCESCIFLGTVDVGHQKYGGPKFDLYFHRGRNLHSVIARDGDEGPMYISTPIERCGYNVIVGREDYPVITAINRAMNKKLLEGYFNE